MTELTPTFFDKSMSFLARFKLQRKTRIAANNWHKIDFFEGVSGGKKTFMLKFSYAGNVQYHKMSIGEFARLLDVGGEILADIQSDSRIGGKTQ